MQISEGKAQHFAHADYLLLLLKELHDLYRALRIPHEIIVAVRDE